MNEIDDIKEKAFELGLLDLSKLTPDKLTELSSNLFKLVQNTEEEILKTIDNEESN